MVFLIVGIVLCLYGSNAYFAPPSIKLYGEISLDTDLSYLSLPLSLKTFPGFHATRNYMLGELEIGDYVWIRIGPTTPDFYYGYEWDKGETALMGYMEDKGANLWISKVNGLWFYAYRTRGGGVVERFEVSPCAMVSLILTTEDGRVIDSKYAIWNYSTGGST